MKLAHSSYHLGIIDNQQWNNDNTRDDSDDDNCANICKAQSVKSQSEKRL